MKTIALIVPVGMKMLAQAPSKEFSFSYIIQYVRQEMSIIKFIKLIKRNKKIYGTYETY